MTKDEFERELVMAKEALRAEIAKAMIAWLTGGREIADMPMPNGKTVRRCSQEERDRYARFMRLAEQRSKAANKASITLLH